MKYIVLLVILLLPLSPAFGYEYYEIYPFFKANHDPTICFVQWNEQELDEYFYKLTEESVNDWSNKLKEHTENYNSWNIYLRAIPEIENHDYCNIFIIFLDEEIQIEQNDYGNYGATGMSENYEKPTIGIYYMDEDSMVDEKIMLGTIKHELGHAFGLGHYITNQSHLIEQWQKGEDIPSIMIEDIIASNEITELDLKKMISIYGKDGFEYNRTVPDWIKNNAEWWSQGLISNDEYLDAIQYLIDNGVIQV